MGYRYILEKGHPKSIYSLFPTKISTRPRFGQELFMPIRRTQHTRAHRFDGSNEFLQENKSKIKTFADIGPANSLGAVSTYETRLVLEEGASVYAVDIVKFNKEKAAQNSVVRSGKLRIDSVKPLLHAISAKPLPCQCDAIRVGNVFGWMSAEDIVRSINNIWKSLRLNGFLITKHDGIQRIFKKTKSGFILLRQLDKTLDSPL